MRSLLLLLAICLTAACSGRETAPIVIGSKNFTESVILGELLAQTLEEHGCAVDRRLNMGGTFVAHKAIEAGEIDAYVEYSGTALTAILKQPVSSDRARVDQTVRAAYAKRNLTWGPALGFNNTFAMIVRNGDAEKLSLVNISDLSKVTASYQPGFGYEFVERPDGWKGLLAHYNLSFAKQPKTMDLGLTYRALAGNQLDLIAGNSTDGLIDSLGLVALRDDRGYFPPYDAAIVRRNDIDKKCAGAAAKLGKLASTIDDAAMRRMNYAVDGEHRDVSAVVAAFRKR